MTGYEDFDGAEITEYERCITFSLNKVIYLKITPAGFYVFDQFVEDKQLICNALIAWFKNTTQEIEPD